MERGFLCDSESSELIEYFIGGIEMKKRKMLPIFSILASNRGETLVETLVAMLIISLSMAFLASNIAVSVRMGRRAAQEDLNNLNEWNQVECAIRGVSENEELLNDKKIVVEFDNEIENSEKYDGKVSISKNGVYYTYWLKGAGT